MAITSDSVRGIFKGLENGDGAVFFERVADDVDWTVMGTTLSPVTMVARSRSGRYFRQVEPGSSTWRATACRGSDRKGRRGGG